MRRGFLTRTVALLGVLSMALTGCNSFVNEDIASYPLASTMTSAELIDYYAKALDYDSIVSRNVQVHETKYEMRDIEGAKSEKLKELANKCEAILGSDNYELSVDNLRLVSRDTYDYIKGVIDNEVLSDGKVQNIRGALGYYFVDVKYNVTAKTPGTFKEIVNIVGLNGAFHKDYLGKYVVNEQYLSVVVNKLNEYYFDNGIVKCAKLDTDKLNIKILDNTKPVVSDSYKDKYDTSSSNETEELLEEEFTEEESIDDELDLDTEEILNAPGDEEEQDEELSEVEINDTEATEVENEATEVENETSVEEETTSEELPEEIGENETSVEEEVTEDSDKENNDQQLIVGTPIQSVIDSSDSDNYTIVTPDSRRLTLDLNLISKIIGSYTGETAMVPDIEMVYNKPSTEGSISGLGIYPAGGNGLKTFGFDREALTGTMTLRYVFKDDSEGTGDILGVNIYVIEEEITNGINMASNNVLIPEFLMSEFEQMIERADRAMINEDIAGLISGSIFEDVGVAILRGTREKSTGIHRYMSKIRQVVNRDTANNSYLLEVETTLMEGARDVDAYGTYKEIAYVVIQQQNNRFVINDWCRVSRILTNEPAIDPDSNVQKRLIALNLAGVISDDSKDSIKELLGNLYTAGTNRLLTGPKDLVINGQTTTIEKGMYDCFSADTTILTSDDREYQNSVLRNVLIKHGIDVQSFYSGTVTEWIGGYEDQAEFTTEELVTYVGLNKGHYMKVYYLAHIENDEWVITERTVLDEGEITDGELKSVQERVGQNFGN